MGISEWDTLASVKEQTRLKLLDIALEETAEYQAPFPEGKIPRRSLFGNVCRRLVQSIFLPFVLLDHLSYRLAFKFVRPAIRRGGECKRRGNCCVHILVRKVKGFNRFNLFWQTRINGFYFRDTQPYQTEKGEYYLMGCRHLGKDGRCTNYRFRPAICRKWPRIEGFGQPKALKGCGYFPLYKQR